MHAHRFGLGLTGAVVSRVFLSGAEMVSRQNTLSGEESDWMNRLETAVGEVGWRQERGRRVRLRSSDIRK
jgi:hypothetical protein